MTTPGAPWGPPSPHDEPRPPAAVPGTDERQNWAPPTWTGQSQAYPEPHSGAWPPPSAGPADGQQWSPQGAVLPKVPVTATTYPQFWRAPGIPLWRPILATVLAAVGFFIVSGVVSLIVLIIEAQVSGTGLGELAGGLLKGRYTPGAILGNSLGLALIIPVTFLAAAVVGQRPGFLSSVAGKFRWGWFLRCALIAVPFLIVYLLFTIAVEGIGSLGLEVKPYSWWLLIGLLIVTPFQSAAEEYLLRGVLLRTVGSWFAADRVAFVVGAVVSSVVFTFLHGASDPWLNCFYFAMGMLLSWLAWRTGGLEASIAVHAVNNLLGMSFLPFQDLDTLFNRAAGAGNPVVLVQIVLLALSCLLIALAARRRGLQRTGPGAAPQEAVAAGEA